MDYEKKLLNKRIINPETGCWNWTGSTNPSGYGQLNDKGRLIRVHRVAAHIWKGLDLNDSKTCVLHKCDNKKCYNPEHLYLGTKKDNSRDYHESLRKQGRFIQNWFTKAKNDSSITRRN